MLSDGGSFMNESAMSLADELAQVHRSPAQEDQDGEWGVCLTVRALMVSDFHRVPDISHSIWVI